MGTLFPDKFAVHITYTIYFHLYDCSVRRRVNRKASVISLTNKSGIILSGVKLSKYKVCRRIGITMEAAVNIGYIHETVISGKACGGVFFKFEPLALDVGYLGATTKIKGRRIRCGDW